MFAHEFGVAYAFSPLFDLMSQAAADYAGNPALKLPIFESNDGAWFGALNICRELARRAPEPVHVVWPEALSDRVAANAQELVLQGMATEVGLIMRGAGAAASPSTYDDKARASLTNTLAWLDGSWPAALQTLPPERTLSFLEVTAFCFVTHLEFRSVTDTHRYRSLREFCQLYANRPSALATEYAFDKQSG